MEEKDGFKISYATPAPLDEQETIITYDKQLKEWYFYTNNPTHARQYEDRISPNSDYRSVKVYHIDNNELIELEGIINGSVSIRKKRTYTAKEKQEMAERMKENFEKVNN